MIASPLTRGLTRDALFDWLELFLALALICRLEARVLTGRGLRQRVAPDGSELISALRLVLDHVQAMFCYHNRRSSQCKRQLENERDSKQDFPPDFSI